MKNYFVYFLVIGLISCSSGMSKSDNKFDAFYFTKAKFKVLNDAFELNSPCIFPEEDVVDAKRIDTENDFSFFKLKESMPVSIGMLPDTSNYYLFIYGQAAACYTPYLVVFNKKGKLIDEQPIFYGGGAGCGYRWTSSLKLKSTNQVVSRYNEESFECDSLSNPTPGTWNKFEDVYTYRISSKGKIIMSKIHNQIVEE
jgi:hypothetical protein